MSNFKAKMHQIQFLLGSAPESQTPLGDLTALPQTLLPVFKKAYTSKDLGDGGEMGRVREGNGRGGRGKVNSREGYPLHLGILDPAVEEGREGIRARRRAWVGASRHLFFPL